MSSAQAGGGPRTCRLYWCYECGRALRIISLPSSDVFCPRCFGRFLHEIDVPPRPLLPPPRLFPPPLFPDDVPVGRRPWVIYGGDPNDGRRRVGFAAPRRLPALPMLPPAVPPGIDTGDYFTGPNFNELVEELTQNDRPGAEPAPTSAIESLPTVRISAAHLSEGSQCPVCKEEFELGEAARELPCKHVYHSDCIVPWLRLHNSCPVCRSQLPSGAGGDSRSSQGTTGDGGGGERRERGAPTMVRWGPLSWLWPPREAEDDVWEYGRRGRGEAADDGGAGAFYAWWRSLFLF